MFTRQTRVWPLILIIGLAAFMAAAETGASAATAAEGEATPAAAAAAATPMDMLLEAIGAPVRETWRGTVAAATDSDKLSILRNGTATTIRLYGADAPEPDQKGHEDAVNYVKEHFLNAEVNVHILTEDSEKVPVALVVTLESESIGHNMVAQGQAWWDQQNTPKDMLLRKLNATAITQGLGLYADATALSPYDFRDSRGLTHATYTLDKPEPKPKPKPAPKEEVKSISAKGTMTQDRPRTTAPTQKPAGAVSIPKDANIDADLPSLMIRHQPRIATDENGNPLGLTATDVGAIPYASQLGFRDGDIVSQVNGVPIQSEAQIMSLIPQFKDVKQFQVEVIRNGQRVTIPISVP